MKNQNCTCSHTRYVTEKNNGLSQSWCLDCPHTWLEINIDEPRKKTGTTGPMTIYGGDT